MKEIYSKIEDISIDRFSNVEVNTEKIEYKFLNNNDIENLPGPDWKGSADNLTLVQLIDLDVIIPLLKNLSKLMQISCELVNSKGEILIAQSKQDICVEFHRKHPVSFATCIRDRKQILLSGLEQGYQEFTCQNGFTDIVIPIHIQGKLLGAFFIGPFFRNKNETVISSLKQQSVKLGFETSSYSMALEAVPVLNEERSSCIISIFTDLINLIKSIVLRNLAIANELDQRSKKDNEIQLAYKKVEEADKLKSAFLANMSHEIRTPMNSIIGFSELMTRENLSDEDRLGFINIIKESGQVLLELIDDLIDVSRIEANQITITKTEFDVKELLNEVYMSFIEQSVLLNKSDIELLLAIPDSNAIVLYSDRIRIKQILSNLIRNAYKFSERGPIQFGCRDNSNEIIFYVSDSGIGISEDQKEFIFERFRQGENTLSRKFGGAGLGLSISKDLCNLLGGNIWLESEINSGSTFCFSIQK